MSLGVFDRLRLGPIELPNRLAMAPVKTALGGTDGVATARHTAYYRRRAAGGVGLIILEPMFVDPRGREHPRQLGAHDDAVVPALRALVEALHAAGSRVFAHLNHAGRAANPKVLGGPAEAPSAVACPATGAVPEAMSERRIRQLVAAYGAAARRVREAGCDGVELQLGLGYLPAQFLSPRTNSRTDIWGGELGCWRFIDEVVETVRATLGPDLALTARLSADEKVPGGLGFPDAVRLGGRIASQGVDALHVVTGSACDSPAWYYQHMALLPGVNEELASRLKKEVALPVLVAGRLGDPQRIREVIRDQLADMVALGRPLLADPDLPLKMRSGRENEIMRCGACLQGCLCEVKRGVPVACLVNPELGHEGEEGGRPRGFGKRLVVVGGGPAGLAAALAASRAGWEVILLERGPALGGQFALASLTPTKMAMEAPFRSLVRAVEASKVEVRLGVEAEPSTVLALAPDRVVVATGSRPLVPPVPGLDDPLFAAEVLSGSREVGHRVLVLGGGMVGSELAEHLATCGHEVVVVELLDDMARDMDALTRSMMLHRFAELPMSLRTRTRLLDLSDGEARVRDERTGVESSLGRFDSVLVAVGAASHDPLSAALRADGLEVAVIGDAHQPGRILDATRAGREVIAVVGKEWLPCAT